MTTKSLLFILMIFTLSTVNPDLLYSQQTDLLSDTSVHLKRFSETQSAQRSSLHVNDPVITDMIGEISVDSISKTLRELQNWGSRYALNDNHRAIAISLVDKFISYGYTDVKLDSFYCNTAMNPTPDSTLQYNVVCNFLGSSAPDEIYIIGGHYDSYSNFDPYNVAPGIDDDGSAVASIFEIARVMAKMNYHPEATIQFTLFAAEELWMKGSYYSAPKAKQEGKDIRYMLNMDMIGNNQDTLNQLVIYSFGGYEWACNVSAAAVEQYTGLSVIIADATGSTSGDYGPYITEGYPTISYREEQFSPYYHSPSDTLGNCNIPYIAMITGGALATLAEQQLLPHPQNLIAYSTKQDITLQWKPTVNASIQGVNIFRSDIAGSQYQKITPAPINSSIFHDLYTEPNKQYFYVITTVNNLMQESDYSNEVAGARYNFSDTLLVLANIKANQVTPDSVLAFYEYALDTIPFIWYDVNATQKVNPAMFSKYRSVFWISNIADFEDQDTSFHQYVSDFIANGGNLLYTGFSPMKFWMNSSQYPSKTTETSLFRQLFKVDSVDRKMQSLLFRANAVEAGYNTLNIDLMKHTLPTFQGQINNVEVFTPADKANVIYRFDTKYDSTTNLGKMKHRPVGLEYMGTDFKSILLSFPLFYLDTTDARKFLHYVIDEKFRSSVGIQSRQEVEPFNLHIYPNPATDACNVTFNISESGHVKLTIFSIQGQVVLSLIDRDLQQGPYDISFDIGSQDPGLYQIVLESEEGMSTRKIVILR